MSYYEFTVTVRVRVRDMIERYVLCWETKEKNMAVPLASDNHIINVSFFKGYVSLKPFLKSTSFVQDVSSTLSIIIQREAVRA